MKLLIAAAAVAALLPAAAMGQPRPQPSAPACPTVSTTGPSDLVPPSQTATLVANVSGAGDYTYNWAISTGSIESGQGTPVIKVSAPAESFVTATVEVGGLDRECSPTSSFSYETGKE